MQSPWIIIEFTPNRIGIVAFCASANAAIHNRYALDRVLKNDGFHQVWAYSAWESVYGDQLAVYVTPAPEPSPAYVVHTCDVVDMDTPIGASPVFGSYVKAQEVAKELRAQHVAQGEDYLIVTIVRHDETGEHVVCKQ